MAHIRVLLVELPRFLNDVVRGIVGGDDEFKIIGESDLDAMRDALRANPADVVILAIADNDIADPLQLLQRHPEVARVVTIDHAGRWANGYEVGAAPRRVLEVSAAKLLDLIRGPNDPGPRCT